MFYLNGTQIDEPAGWSGVYWTRVRHPDYFGIWRHRTAKVMGVGEVGFDGEARYLLQSLRKKYGVNAAALFEVKDGGEVIYSAEIDFAVWNDNGRYFNVSFRDEDIELDSLSGVLFSVEPKIQIEFPEQPISDGLGYTVSSDFMNPFYAGARHSIPLATSKSGEGNGLSVETPANQEPIYRNGTNRKSVLQLQGNIIGIWQGTGNVELRAEVVQEGNVIDSRLVSVFNASGGQQHAHVLENIEIQPGAYLRLIVSSGSGLNVSYSAESYLTIYENAETKSALIWGVTWKQVIESLLANMTGGKVRLSSTYLSKGDGASRTLTSERNMRGYRSNLLVSFKAFWDDMNMIDNLACWRRGNTLHIEKKSDMIGKVGFSRIYDFESLVHYPSPFYSSSYQVGYKNWQSGTSAGREEFCTERTYLTEQQKVKASRPLTVNTLSASGKTMEALRRNPNSDKADTAQDEKLFVIVADKAGSTYVSRTGHVEGVISPANVINADISPRRNLLRWINTLGVNGRAMFTAGTGNISAVCYNVSESAGVDPSQIPQIFTDRSLSIETGMTMRQYSELGEVIEYHDHDGELKSALIMEDSYRFTTGKVLIKAIELQ
jgi:hypothetical protein